MAPVIIAETERLIIRRFTLDDAKAMEAVRCDPDVMTYSQGVMQPSAIKEWLKQILRSYDKIGYDHWAVDEKSSGETVGYCGLFHDRNLWAKDQGEIGYRFAKAHWGKGYATEAARAVIAVGFRDFGLRKIVALIDPENEGSVRIAKKLGMTFEREMMLDWYDHPDHVYVIDASALREQPVDEF